MSENPQEYSSLDAFLNGISYFSSPSISVFVGGGEAQLGIGLEIDVSYIQVTPQQMMVPVYNIFSSMPSMVLTGNSIVKGAIGFNFTLSTYVQEIANSTFQEETRYGGSFATYSRYPSIKGNGSLYVPHMRIEFINDVLLNHVEDGYKIVVPTVSMYDVYISGGVITAAPDGSPVQDIYQFIARKMTRADYAKTFLELSINTPDVPDENTED
ncbi:hypothetical protein [Mesotoga prima]|uniref:hypothetical protein n=1 Tax=Mesotoga prima TaxID=1184387 RepID=UPI002FD9CC6C